ncbi:MAG: hypothetical protein V5B33_02090 [Candidatus Accumulibacter sp. UW20]
MKMNNYLEPDYWNSCSSLDSKTEQNLQQLSTAFWKDRREDAIYSRKIGALSALGFLDRLMQREDECYPKALLYRYELLFRMKMSQETLALASRRSFVFEEGTLGYYETYYLGVAYWQLGRTEDAKACFEKLPQKIRPSIRRHIDQFYKQMAQTESGLDSTFDFGVVAEQIIGFDIRASTQQILRYYEAQQVSNINGEDLRSLLCAAALAIRNLKRHEAALAETDDAPYDGQSFGQHLLFVTGFGWSGSGAVTDFLSHYKGISTALGTNQELVWLQGRKELVAVYDCICQPFALNNVIEFLMGGILGLPSPFHNNSRSARQFRLERSIIGRALSDSSAIADLLFLATEFILKLVLVQTAREYRHAFIWLLLRLMYCYYDKKPILLINNGLLAHKFALARHIPNASFIVVRRNILDTYCARKLESPNPGSLRNPLQFVEITRSNDSAYCTALATHRSSPNSGPVLEISFENFVRQASTREEVIRFVGPLIGDSIVSDVVPKGIKEFDPTISERNIDIYKTFPNAEDIQILAREFGIEYP